MDIQIELEAPREEMIQVEALHSSGTVVVSEGLLAPPGRSLVRLSIEGPVWLSYRGHLNVRALAGDVSSEACKVKG